VPGAWCLVPGAWCLVPGAWCLVPGAWCLVPGAWCLHLRPEIRLFAVFSGFPTTRFGIPEISLNNIHIPEPGLRIPEIHYFGKLV
jgi:hypothetical protein